MRSVKTALVLTWCIAGIAWADLTAQQARELQDATWQARVADVQKQKPTLLEQGTITAAGKTMKFRHRTLGTKPVAGWDLYIILHGGGGTTQAVNDQQWSGMVNYYSPDQALVIAPRAPTDTWNLWHESHIDPLFTELISTLVAAGEVNPNRVYVMGYSAGGDGVYQIAPRMADRFAAAGMMAGHPNEASPLGLRNIGFALHVGALDHAYNRSGVAARWQQWLGDLQRADPHGYRHEFQLHEGREHWMRKEEVSALKFIGSFTRDPLPATVVWKQDDVTHDSLYWLAVPKGQAKQGSLVIARHEGQTITIDTAEGVDRILIRLNDDMLDLDKPVIVRAGGRTLFSGRVERNESLIRQTLSDRADPGLCFSAEVAVDLNRPAPTELKGAAAYLRRHQPPLDDSTIDGAFLQKQSDAAVAARAEFPWGPTLPDELFNEYVLPYANVDEVRDDWRETLTSIARQIVAGKPTITEAAMALNNELFGKVNVRYHPTKRPRPNQSPKESVDVGFASCSGLSILLVDACRSVSIPARLVGTPAWSTGKGDGSGNHGGNHTWVEIWDGTQWRFIGAAEPSAFDQTWFVDNAKRAATGNPLNGIYAVRFERRSPLHFPMVWNPNDQSVPAVDRTMDYAKRCAVTFSFPAQTNPSPNGEAKVTLRDSGDIVAVLTRATPTANLAAGRLYVAEVDGKSRQFTLSDEATQTMDLSTISAR